MFALRFDDLKRKVAKSDPPVELFKLTTAMQGTEEWDVYMGLYLADDNDTIHLEIEDDRRTYTFFTINPTLNTKLKAGEPIGTKEVQPTGTV